MLMEQKKFAEYKSILEQSLAQTDFQRNVTFHNAEKNAILATTTYKTSCIIETHERVIYLLKLLNTNLLTYGYHSEIDLSDPNSTQKLGETLKCLLSPKYQ